MPLPPNYVLSQTEEGLVVRNFEGKLHYYRNPQGGLPRNRRRSQPLHLPVASLFNEADLAVKTQSSRDEDKVAVRVTRNRRNVKPVAIPMARLFEDNGGIGQTL